MKLRWLPALLALCAFAATARAQVGLYFNPLVTHVSVSQPDAAPFAFLGQNTTSRIFGGISTGGYYTLKTASPKIGFGLDVRDEIEHGHSALLNSFLLGLRVAGKGPSLKPYVELLGGVGTTHSQQSPARINKGQFKVYAGADYRLGKHVDLRIAEVGYGSLTAVSSAQFGGHTAIPAAQLLSFSTGFVFRIP